MGESGSGMLEKRTWPVGLFNIPLYFLFSARVCSVSVDVSVTNTMYTEILLVSRYIEPKRRHPLPRLLYGASETFI